MFTKKRKLKKIPKPISKLKKRNYKPEEKKINKFPKFNKIHILAFSFLLFFLGLIYYVIKYESHKVKIVTCKVEYATCDQVGISIPNLIGENFFKYKFDPLINKLNYNFPQIESIKTSKKFPSKFEIQISLRKPKALIEDKFLNHYFVDSHGMVFGQTFEQKNNFIIIKTEESIFLGQKIVSPNILFSLKLVDYLESSLLPVKEISIQNNGNIKVNLQNGKTVHFTAEKDVQKQADSLIFILNNPQIDENKKNIIDLRFENPIVK